ncbi:MAG: amino acid adenylation domain-containing protein [Thainema sp.]
MLGHSFSHTTIHEAIEHQARQTPQAKAIIWQQTSLTYAELNQRANQLAHYLIHSGVQPECFVGVCLERSLDMVVALLAILKAGGAYVPLDPTYPSDRLAFIIEDTQLPLVITQVSLQPCLPEYQAKAIYLDTEQSTLEQFSIQNPDTWQNPAQGVNPHNLAYVIYTSGSTGRPKGVAIEHRNAIALIDWARELYTSEQLAGVLAATSLCFDLSIFELFVTLSCGGTVILAKDALQLPRLPAANQVTLINTVPSAIAELLRIDGIPTSVKTINLAGEPLQNTLAQQLYQLDHVEQVYNLYGPSEDTTYSTVALVQKGATTSPSIGRPISNTQIYLLDSRLNLVQEGAEGEIYISGAGIAREYLNRPDLTAERFLPNPYNKQAPHDRLYKTGDLATYSADGTLNYLGRIDHQVKVRGFRIELGEIEFALSEYPDIRQVVVVARGDAPDRTNKRLVAYVVPDVVPEINEHLTSITPRSLRDYLQQKLPNYMIPSAFMLLDEMPLTLNGKVDRRALPVPKWSRMEEGTYVPPSRPLEIQLAYIWSQLLGVEHIGIHDGFCELGGHSLLSVQLMAQLQQTLNVEVPLEVFLETPTIAGLAQAIEYLQQGQQLFTSIDSIEASIQLDARVQPQHQLTAPVMNFFLTGATGFLGGFILHELLEQTHADVYCLVRADSLEEGRARLQQVLQRYYLWEEAFDYRIIPVLGDLSKPELGIEPALFQRLSEKIDAIYHCGAWVNMVYPYATLEPTNVKGTQEVLRLASQSHPKPVHYVSTTDVFSTAARAGLHSVCELTPIGPAKALYSGYAQTKYAAERLVMAARDRGLPVAIYRPGNIIGSQQTGICQTSDFVAKLLKGCLQAGAAPQIEASLNLSPVDFVSRTIVRLSCHTLPQGQAFLVVNPDSLSWSQSIDRLRQAGYSLQTLPYEAWYSLLLKQIAQTTSIKDPDSNVLAPLVSLLTYQGFVQKLLGALEFDQLRQLSQLTRYAIEYPPSAIDSLDLYISYLSQCRFLPKPVLSSQLMA